MFTMDPSTERVIWYRHTSVYSHHVWMLMPKTASPPLVHPSVKNGCALLPRLPGTFTM